MCGLVVFCYERDRDGCYQNRMGFPAKAIQKRRPRPGLVKTMWWPKETGVKIVILSLSSVESPVPNAYSKLRGGSRQEEWNPEVVQ